MTKENIEKFLKAIILNKKNLEKDLPFYVKGKKKLKAGVYFGKNVSTEPNVFFDTKEGDIVVDDGTKIKANAVLRGPLYIGKNCTVNSFAEIASSRIGNVCKVGGEFSDSIMGDYSNKQHYGSVGHSYIGKWVNIGGGTSISSLKNTYSNIKVRGIDTGEVFMGAIIGDYSKTAINTSVFCGKVIGESSHLYGIVSEDVPAFTSYIRPGALYEMPLEVAEKIQKAMMRRRGLAFSDKEHQYFLKLFNETAPDRKKAKVKKGKLKF